MCSFLCFHHRPPNVSVWREAGPCEPFRKCVTNRFPPVKHFIKRSWDGEREGGGQPLVGASKRSDSSLDVVRSAGGSAADMPTPYRRASAPLAPGSAL